MSRRTPIRRPIPPDTTPSVATSLGISVLFVGTVVALLAAASAPSLAVAFVAGVGTTALVRVGRRTLASRRDPDGIVGSPERSTS